MDIQVLTTNSDGIGKVIQEQPNQNIRLGGNFHVLYSRRWIRHSVAPFLLRVLPGFLRQADLVHLTGVYSFPTFPCLFLCKQLNIPVVWSPRGSLQRWPGSRRNQLKKLWDKFCQSVLPSNLTVHVTSINEELESREKFPHIPFAVIPNGVKFPKFINPTPSNGPLRLLFLGRLDQKKGIENLLEACRKLKSTFKKPFSLIIAGAGDLSYTAFIRNYVEKLSLGEEVHMMGQVDDKEKLGLFNVTDITVIPSHTENFGIVVAESLAHGVPVIASHGTPWAEIEEIGCGLWVDNSPASLARAICQMSEKPLLEMGDHGRKWVKDKFSWPAIADEMAKLYSSMIGGRD